MNNPGYDSPKNFASVSSLGGLVTKDTATSAIAEHAVIATTGNKGGIMPSNQCGDPGSGKAYRTFKPKSDR